MYKITTLVDYIIQFDITNEFDMVVNAVSNKKGSIFFSKFLTNKLQALVDSKVIQVNQVKNVKAIDRNQIKKILEPMFDKDIAFVDNDNDDNISKNEVTTNPQVDSYLPLVRKRKSRKH